MKTRLIAVAGAFAGLAALAQPAVACPAGYQAVWIQGNKVCKIKTPNLPLAPNKKRELSGGAKAFKSR